jgi:hypothetical protein
MRGKGFSINEEYFDVIDTEEKAYILGFIFADGNISGERTKYRLRITLKYEDSEILGKIKDELQYTGDIKIRELKSKQRDTKGYMIAELSIINKYLITRLVELGCIPNKSLTVKYPDIPDDLDKHFIRGYFDGNGSIYFTNNRVGFELMSGSKDIYYSMKEKILSNTSVNPLGEQERKTSIRWTKSGKQAIEILHYLYKDSNISLRRKFEKYKQYAV